MNQITQILNALNSHITLTIINKSYIFFKRSPFGNSVVKGESGDPIYYNQQWSYNFFFNGICRYV